MTDPVAPTPPPVIDTAPPAPIAPPLPVPTPAPSLPPVQQPSIGRVVHVNRDGKPPYAALVTAVHSPTCVSLVVFGDGQSWENGTPADVASQHMSSVSLGSSPGTWTWPPRV